MIANNIGQLAYLLATRGGERERESERESKSESESKRERERQTDPSSTPTLSTIIFAGGFVENDYLKERLSYAVSFWSKGAMSAQFAVHNAYLGALGAFLESSRYEEE